MVNNSNKVIIKGCEFNPKGLPNKKTGTCQNEEHYEWLGGSDIKERGQELQLIMMFSDEYNEKWCECSKKYELSDEEFDKKAEAMEKIKFKPDSEKYYCKNCVEILVESSCQ